MTLIAGAGVCYSAQADTIVEDVNIPHQTKDDFDYLGIAFAKFDPALGTLNSLTFNITGTYTGSDTGSVGDPSYFDSLIRFLANTMNTGPGGDDIHLTSPNAAQDLSGSGSFSYTDTDTFDAPAFVGTGTAQIGDLVEGFTGSFYGLTVAADLTVTYNYTPAISATPLPAALSLFAGGLGMIGFLSRRRKRKNTGTLATA